MTYHEFVLCGKFCFAFWPDRPRPPIYIASDADVKDLVSHFSDPLCQDAGIRKLPFTPPPGLTKKPLHRFRRSDRVPTQFDEHRLSRGILT